MTEQEKIKKAIRHFECMRDDAKAVLDTGFGTHEGESSIVYDNRKMYAELAISALEKQIDGDWIPCSERLPKIYDDTCTSEIVLVQGYDKEIDYDWQAMGWYTDEAKQWYFAECKNTDKQIDWIDIIAWMPLPQPYTESRKES